MTLMSIKKWMSIAAVQLVTVIFYFLAVRPLRELFSEWAGSFIFNMPSGVEGFVQSVVRNGVTINTIYSLNDSELIFSYAPQFGFFFLIAVIGLNFLHPGIKIYLLLVSFHFLIEGLSLGFTAIAFKGYFVGFVIADFLLLYLSPLVSLGFILFVVLKRKGKIRFES